MRPIVQISLDLTSIDEALETAALALRAGVDWLEEILALGGGMGDNLSCTDMIAAAKWLGDLGCDFVIHHLPKLYPIFFRQQNTYQFPQHFLHKSYRDNYRHKRL